MKSFGYKGGTLQDKLCSSCRDFNVSGFCIFVLSFQRSWILHDSKVFLKLNIANFTHQSLLCLGVLVHILKISCIKTSSTGSFVNVIWISISWGWKLQIRPFCSNHRLCAYEYNTGEFTPLMLESCILGNAGGKFWKKTKSYVKILFLINVSNGFVNFECGLFCSHFCVFICGIFRIAVSTRAEVVITHRLSDITQSKTEGFWAPHRMLYNCFNSSWCWFKKAPETFLIQFGQCWYDSITQLLLMLRLRIHDISLALHHIP